MRAPGDTTPEGRRFYAKLLRAQEALERTESRRDQLVRESLDAGMGVRAVARVLKIDKGTVSRRYGRGTK